MSIAPSVKAFLLLCLLVILLHPGIGDSSAPKVSLSESVDLPSLVGGSNADITVFKRRDQEASNAGDELARQIVYIFDPRSGRCFACTANKTEDGPVLVSIAGPVPYEQVKHVLLNPPNMPP